MLVGVAVVAGQTLSMHRLETKIPPVVVGALAGLLGWGVGRLDLDDAPLDNTVGLVIGVVLGLVGAAIGAAGVVQFQRAATTVNPHSIHQASNVVYSGIYRFTRNPMYAGMLLIVVAWCAALGTIVGAVVAAVVFVASITRFQIIPEERMLTDKFGAVYSHYCGRVRRWF